MRGRATNGSDTAVSIANRCVPNVLSVRRREVESDPQGGNEAARWLCDGSAPLSDSRSDKCFPLCLLLVCRRAELAGDNWHGGCEPDVCTTVCWERAGWSWRQGGGGQQLIAACTTSRPAAQGSARR